MHNTHSVMIVLSFHHHRNEIPELLKAPLSLRGSSNMLSSGKRQSSEITSINTYAGKTNVCIVFTYILFTCGLSPSLTSSKTIDMALWLLLVCECVV